MDQPITAMNQDISWGGAQFVAVVPVDALSGTLRLVFPWRGQRQGCGRGRSGAGAALGRRSLSGRGSICEPLAEKPGQARKAAEDARCGGRVGQSREEAPLVRELEVAVEDAGGMREMLEQIMSGHLSITVFESYAAGQSIRLAIRGADKLPGLRLRARVLEVAHAKVEGFAQSELFSLELGFEHPQSAIKAFIELLIAQLPPVRIDPESDLAGAPDWLRAMHVARPTEDLALRTASISRSAGVGVAAIPDALMAIRMAWGDPESFDLAFQDLTLGSRAEPGGWPQDAWEELGFLQDVHDEAYGLPASRLSLLRPTRCR
jgi:hypothetical protein